MYNISLAAVNHNVCHVREKKKHYFMEMTMKETDVIHVVKIKSIYVYIIIEGQENFPVSAGKFSCQCWI